MKVELLAPAGDLEKLKYAYKYGADAVYVGDQLFGLRTASKNFTLEELEEAVVYAHDLGKKIYLVLNVIAHNEDIDLLKDYLIKIKHIEFDAFIISDPGILMVAKDVMGDREYHLSTQANSTNFMSSKFWVSQGITRIILARELSLDEIARNVVELNGTEFEVFVHGAMCMAYSGRCLISNYLTGRDANKGDCAGACRWNYTLSEQKREGEFFPVEEDERGTYFFNSKDLCALPLLDKIIETGVKSLKIEGRNKTPYYVASVVRVYRKAIDDYYDGKDYDPALFEELKKVSHRDFTTGFFLGGAQQDSQVYGTNSYIRTHDFLGSVEEYDDETKLAKIIQRNKFRVGDDIEIIGPNYKEIKLTVEEMYDEKMNAIDSCPHAKQVLYIRCEQKLHPMDMLRKEKGTSK